MNSAVVILSKILIFLLTTILVDVKDVFNFNQNDYQVEFDRVEMASYNKKHVHYMNVQNFKYNRTHKAINSSICLATDFGYNLQVIVQVFQFLSNEYRHFPLRFQQNMCQALDKDMIGASKILNCGNFTGCPLVKNAPFYFCNWQSDSKKFPPMIPNGKYKINIRFEYKESEVATLHFYSSITRPV